MANILSSWKEIAGYIGRSVRTVQRWERELGLPVHRPSAKNEGVVVALPAELDAWVRAMPTNSHFKGADGIDANGDGASNGNGNGQDRAAATKSGRSNGETRLPDGKARSPRPVRVVPRPSA